MIVILVAATVEWNVLCTYLKVEQVSEHPFGEFFHSTLTINDKSVDVCYARIGWGKISAAAGTQYVIDRWNPKLLINIGTCGGIGGRVNTGDVILATQTYIYDMHVEIGDPVGEHDFYAIEQDISGLAEDNLPLGIRKGAILTGDSDLKVSDIARLTSRYATALAADWESGAVAFVASRNKIRCLILRYVSDVIHDTYGEAYGENQHLFEEQTALGVPILAASLPEWIERVKGRME